MSAQADIAPPVFFGDYVFSDAAQGRGSVEGVGQLFASYYSAYVAYAEARASNERWTGVSCKVGLRGRKCGALRDGSDGYVETCETASFQGTGGKTEVEGQAYVGKVVLNAEQFGPNGGKSVGRGSNYVRNTERRLRKKERDSRAKLGREDQKDVPVWRKSAKGFGAVGSCETVYSGSSGTLVEAEEKARETLALRRIAENKLAVEKANALISSYGDEAKTKALADLRAIKIVQRANEARAKAQESWKRCDESLGSLGSTGSAGEFYWKREVQKGKDFERKYDYARRQCMVLMQHASSEVLDICRNMPEPVSEAMDEQEYNDMLYDIDTREEYARMCNGV